MRTRALLEVGGLGIERFEKLAGGGDLALFVHAPGCMGTLEPGGLALLEQDGRAAGD